MNKNYLESMFLGTLSIPSSMIFCSVSTRVYFFFFQTICLCFVYLSSTAFHFFARSIKWGSFPSLIWKNSVCISLNMWLYINIWGFFLIYQISFDIKSNLLLILPVCYIKILIDYFFLLAFDNYMYISLVMDEWNGLT